MDTKFYDLSNTKSRISIQQKSSKQVVIGGKGKFPDDGGYVAVIDLEKKSATETQVAYHITYNVKDDVYQPTRDFLSGKEGACKFNQ